MRVITICTESKGMRIKGDMFVYEHIQSIVQESNKIRLVRNANYETLLNKNAYRIIDVEFD